MNKEFTKKYNEALKELYKDPNGFNTLVGHFIETLKVFAKQNNTTTVVLLERILSVEKKEVSKERQG